MSKALTAGRELDALVAEKVMGAEWRNMTPAGRKRVLSFPHDRPMAMMDGKEFILYGGPDEKDQYLPHYSTSIADAWAVVEKMKPKRLNLEKIDANWAASFHFGGYAEGSGYAETAPLAICLAALNALSTLEPKRTK
jgi:hypothetical protein